MSWWQENSESEDPDLYKKKPGTPAHDKGSHKERSIGNDRRRGGHSKHWSKEEKKKKKWWGWAQ
jgi:hypothetical protein